MINVIISYNITLIEWSYDNSWLFTSKRQLYRFRKDFKQSKKESMGSFFLAYLTHKPNNLDFWPCNNRCTKPAIIGRYTRAMYRKLSLYRTDFYLSNHDIEQWKIIAIVIFNSIQDSEFLHRRGRGGKWGVFKSLCHSHDFEIWYFLYPWKLFFN